MSTTQQWCSLFYQDSVVFVGDWVSVWPRGSIHIDKETLGAACIPIVCYLPSGAFKATMWRGAFPIRYVSYLGTFI